MSLRRSVGGVPPEIPCSRPSRPAAPPFAGGAGEGRRYLAERLRALRAPAEVGEAFAFRQARPRETGSGSRSGQPGGGGEHTQRRPRAAKGRPLGHPSSWPAQLQQRLVGGRIFSATRSSQSSSTVSSAMALTQGPPGSDPDPGFGDFGRPPRDARASSCLPVVLGRTNTQPPETVQVRLEQSPWTGCYGMFGGVVSLRSEGMCLCTRQGGRCSGVVHTVGADQTAEAAIRSEELENDRHQSLGPPLASIASMVASILSLAASSQRRKAGLDSRPGS